MSSLGSAPRGAFSLILSIVPSYTYRDGELIETPDTEISTDTVLTRRITETVHVSNGAHVVLTGPATGTVNVVSGELTANEVTGTVHVGRGSKATFEWCMSGTLHVDQGGTAVIGPRATALGTMHIDGTLINEGTRGVIVQGSGVIDDRPGFSRARTGGGHGRRHVDLLQLGVGVTSGPLPTSPAAMAWSGHRRIPCVLPIRALTLATHSMHGARALGDRGSTRRRGLANATVNDSCD
jgi:hypothetical protein